MSKAKKQRGNKHEDTSKAVSKRRGRGRPNTNTAADHGDIDRGNNPSWYTGSNQLVKDAATFYFTNSLRGSIPLAQPLSDKVGHDKLITPGICKIEFITTPGDAISVTDPVTIAARKLYSDLRHTNSGSRTYEAPDLMLYLLAMDSLYCFWAHLCRIYGVARSYNASNKYYPDHILTALGAMPDDIRANLVKLRSYINELAIKLNTYSVPKHMTLFQSHMYYHSTILWDRPQIEKAQTYIFVPKGFYQFSTDVSGAAMGDEFTTSCLLAKTAPSMATVDQWIAYGNALFAPIFGDEDFDTISGDMLKCYGSSAMWKLGTIDENYTLFPIYDEAIMPRIHNLHVTPVLYGNGEGAIGQTAEGAIRYNLNFVSTGNTKGNAVLNMPMPNPTPMDILYATRLTNVVDDDGAAWNERTHEGTFGSVLITGLSIFSEVNVFPVDKLTTFNCKEDNMLEVEPMLLLGLLASTHFHSFPLTIWDVDPHSYANNTERKLITAGDLQNFTVLHSSEIKRMHRAALLSEFGITDIS